MNTLWLTKKQNEYFDHLIKEKVRILVSFTHIYLRNECSKKLLKSNLIGKSYFLTLISYH